MSYSCSQGVLVLCVCYLCFLYTLDKTYCSPPHFCLQCVFVLSVHVRGRVSLAVYGCCCVYIVGIRAFTMVMNKNRLDQKKRVRLQIYQKATRREHQKLREKFKTRKKSRSHLQIHYYQEIKGEEGKDFTTTLYNNSRFFTTALITTHLLLQRKLGLQVVTFLNCP